MVAPRSASEGARSAEAAPPAGGEPRLALDGFAFHWPGATTPALAGIDLRVEAGSCVFVGGASGAGKSTLLRAVAGLLPDRSRTEGRRSSWGRAALLLQNVDTQLLATRVEDELDFGLSLRGLPPAERRMRAERALSALGLQGFSGRSVDDLSAGEKQRVVLAALVALEPEILLLDEPSSQLDPDARRRLATCLGELKRSGHAIVLADHRFEPWADVVDRRLVLEEGRLAAWVESGEPVARATAPPLAASGPPALSVQDLHVEDAGGRPLLAGVSLEVARGESVHLGGANGAGKSTLLRAIAGLVRPTTGRVRVGGRELRPGRLGLLFQNPERNLFERNVGEEVAFALRRLGWGRSELALRVRDVLARCGLDRVQDRSPLRLSFGEQHRVALASVLAPRPEILLLDEPLTGLDAESRARVLELLEREQREVGFATVMASHDPPPSEGRFHRQLRLVDGGL